MVYTRYSELCRLRTFLWILGLGVLLLYATYKALNEGKEGTVKVSVIETRGYE